MSGGRWTDSLDKKLLLKYIAINATGPRNWDKVAVAMGPGFTTAACKLHFAKILKDGESDAGATTPDASGVIPSTTAGKKRKATATDGGKSPTKQPQKRQRKTAAKAKAKDGDEYDEDNTFVKKAIKEEESEALPSAEDSDEA